jgi:hypothetical protein
MTTLHESVLARMYALQFPELCKKVLEKMKETLSPAELRYVNVIAPKIAEELIECRKNEGTLKGELATREKRSLEKEGLELLEDANIPAERIIFLQQLATLHCELPHQLFTSNAEIRLHLATIYTKGFITQLRKTAEDLHVGADTICLLRDIEILGERSRTDSEKPIFFP